MKRKFISAMPVRRSVSVEAECALKAKQFAARRRIYELWFASQCRKLRAA